MPRPLVLLTLALILSVTTSCQKQMPEQERRERLRPAHIDKDKIKNEIGDWSLLIDGTPIEDHPVLTMGTRVEITGHAELFEGARPNKYSWPSLTVAIRPVGEDEDGDWMMYHIREEFQGNIKRDGRIEGACLPRPNLFSVGEHNARIYFRIKDSMEDNSSAILLATSKITILEADTASAEKSAE